jgi:alpha-2-macroglobulin
VNPEFKSQQMAANLGNIWVSDFNEIREDRALFFRNTLWSGKHEIRYLARVRAAGTSTAPPTKVEEMYHPDRFGLGDSQIVVGKGM